MLAAGASTRMRGVDKLTQPLRGVPILRDRAAMFLKSQVDRLVIVLPENTPTRDSALEGLDVHIVRNPNASSGMASSIKAGIAALTSQTSAALIMPADMPDIEAADIDAICAEYHKAPDHILRATAGQTPGSPVIFPRPYFKDLFRLEGDASGRTVIKAAAEDVRYIQLIGDRATFDLDTPEAWAEWHNRQS